MNQTTAQQDFLFNQSAPLGQNQFCVIALVNNIGNSISYRLGSNNNATVSERLLATDQIVDFSNTTFYDMANYTLFVPLGELGQGVVKTLPPGQTLLLMGANTGVNTTIPSQYQISYQLGSGALSLLGALSGSLCVLLFFSYLV